MKDLISIIIPVYNASNYLNQCLDSVINQTYKNLEIILIDDGSKDDSGKICDNYSKKDKRVMVIHTKNNGQSFARNLGISKANGAYISFIDSDDFVDLNFIKFLYNNSLKYNVDISCCGFSMYYSDDKIINKNKDNIKIKLKTDEAMKYLIVNGLISDSPCNKLFKKNLFKNIEFPIEKVYEDRRILPLVFYKAKNVYYDSNVKYYYRQHMTSTTHNENKLFQLIDATVERKKYIDSKFVNLKKFTTQDLIMSYITVSNVLIKNGDVDKYAEICKEIKKIRKENKYTYKNLKITKKIQMYIFIKFPNLYKNIIKLFKKD